MTDLLQILEPGSLWWLAVAIERGRLLVGEYFSAPLVLEADPTSVIDLRV